MQFSSFVKACSFAAQKHTAQRRKDKMKNPYINHPLEVAELLAAAGVNDVITLSAAVLHDTLEDTDTTMDELCREFGEEVAEVVRQCTDDKSADKVTRKKHQVEHALSISNRAKLVKLADKISNNRSILLEPIWSPEITLGYAIWTQAVLNNLRGTNKHLEDQLEEILMHLGIFQYDEDQRRDLLQKYYASMSSKK